MGPLTAIVWIALTAGRPHPADVSWTASVPLWTSLSPTGRVIGAGPGPTWGSPPPAARLAAPSRTSPEPESAPAPRVLPEIQTGPLLPPGTPAPGLFMTPLTREPVPPRLQPVGLPLVAQASQPRLDRQVVPVGRTVDVGPAARLGSPSP